jgi:hypothetical protein
VESGVINFVVSNSSACLGTDAIGAFSNLLQGRSGDDSFRYFILAGTGFYVISAVLFSLAAGTLARD